MERAGVSVDTREATTVAVMNLISALRAKGIIDEVPQ